MEDLSGFPLEIVGEKNPMVSFKKVRKAYGSLVVLDDLDLDVAAGEMVSVIGPSGSGKTTVLRMLMTLEKIPAIGRWLTRPIGLALLAWAAYILAGMI